MINNSDSIKDFINTDITKSLNLMLNDESHKHKYKLKYVGVVVDNNDPEKRGRCRIRIKEIYGTNIQDRDLPWANPIFDFNGGKRGSFIIPPIDCKVNVELYNNDIYNPFYFGKFGSNELPTNKNTDYPDNMIFYETDNGDKFEINRKKKTSLFEHSSGTKIINTMNESEIRHHSGSTITIDKVGNVIIESAMSISLKHNIMTESNGQVVIPEGVGPFCCLPVCAITGATHTGSKTI